LPSVRAYARIRVPRSPRTDRAVRVRTLDTTPPHAHTRATLSSSHAHGALVPLAERASADSTSGTRFTAADHAAGGHSRDTSQQGQPHQSHSLVPSLPPCESGGVSREIHSGHRFRRLGALAPAGLRFGPHGVSRWGLGAGLGHKMRFSTERDLIPHLVLTLTFPHSTTCLLWG
jgi:hypothetical protein